MLEATQRPVICASSALNTGEGLAAIAALEAACGLPIALMESPRGLLDPAIGDFGTMLAQADLVVLLGKQLDFTLKFGRTTQARFAVIEPAGALIDRAGRLLGERLALVARAAPLEAARALADVAKPHPCQAWADELRAAMAHRPAAWAELAGRGGPIHPATLGAALRPWLDGDCVLVADGGEVGQWMQAMLRTPTRVTNGVAGAIGAGIPFAIAASAARPGRRVLAVMGDGSSGFHLTEFDTAVRHGLPFVCVIGNDARWNAEYQIQVREYGGNRAHGCELAPSARYDLVARALGGHGEFVTTGEELAPALERAFASGKPACVNVLIEGQAAPSLKRG
jgi:acetolactate synthase-1/2/3 large subunit